MEGENRSDTFLKAKHILLRLLNSFWNKNPLAPDSHNIRLPTFSHIALQVQFSSVLWCCLRPFQLLSQKYHRLGDWNNKHLFLSRRLSSPRSRFWQIWCLMRALFLICRQSPSCCISHGREQRAQASSPVSSYKDTNPIHEGATLMT